jgi:hypothetical protein
MKLAGRGNKKTPALPGVSILLGYLDSNQEQMNQNHIIGVMQGKEICFYLGFHIFGYCLIRLG